MADFNQNLSAIKNAVYGKDVRGAIYDALVYLSNNQGSGGGGSSNSGFYTLPIASANTLGGVKISSDFNVSSDGKISLANGNAGKSAYEIAKDQGFKGTEAEWIESLNGGYYTLAMRQTSPEGIILEFIPSKDDMPAGDRLSINLPFGKDGGYYTPTINTTTDGFSLGFTPSKADMPTISPVTVTFPASEQSGSSDTFNVKAYGAKGDGSTDDSKAIQAALNACHSAGGGTVLLPSGVYIIGSANGYVEFYSNTHILGEPGTTLRFHNSLAGTGIQAILRNKTTKGVGGYGCTENCIIENIIFDNNANIQKKATTLGIGHAQNITVKNCTFINGNGKSGSLHYLEFNACKDCKVIDCVFDKAKDAADQKCEMVNLDAATDESYGDDSYYEWDGTKCDNIEIVGCRFYSYKQSELPSGYFMSPAIGSHATALYHNGLNVHDCQFFGDWNPPGVERRYTITFNGALTNTRIYNNLFVAGTPGLSKPPSGISIQCTARNNFIYDNKFVDYGVMLSTSKTVAIHYNNHLINTVNNTAEIDSGTINLSDGVLNIS